MRYRVVLSVLSVVIMAAALAAKLIWKVTECSLCGNFSSSTLPDPIWLLIVLFELEAVIKWECHMSLCVP